VGGYDMGGVGGFCLVPRGNYFVLQIKICPTKFVCMTINVYFCPTLFILKNGMVWKRI
jgi:hypothetical protein